MPAWKPDSWRGKPVLQVPKYPDAAALEAVERDLRNFPPLVFVKEVSDLKAKLGSFDSKQNQLELYDGIEVVSQNGQGSKTAAEKQQARLLPMSSGADLGFPMAWLLRLRQAK